MRNLPSSHPSHLRSASRRQPTTRRRCGELVASALFLLPALSPAAETAVPAEPSLPAITVSGKIDAPSEQTRSYTGGKNDAATGLSLSQRETPQAVSVVTRALMDDFRLNSVNDALDSAAGVRVERVETDRTYYTARGYDITNFQYDGIGQPLVFGNGQGDMDSYLYDRVEVLRGANGLMSGTGNPSATVDFVRKRPTRETQANASISYGSWNDKRIQADVSGSLNDSGSVRGRLVGAAEDKDSYLDRYGLKKQVLQGVIEADISASTLLTAGYAFQRNEAKSPMWGALPLYYSDGTPTHYDRSTSTAADWAYWNSTTQSAFLEASHDFDNGWNTKLSYNYRAYKDDSALFYVYGSPDKTTGQGLYAYPSLYASSNQQDQLDMRANGHYSLGGRQHDLMLGADYSRSFLHDISHYGRGIGSPIGSALEDWDGNYTMPLFDAAINGSRYDDRMLRSFAASRFNLRDDLKLIAGATHTRLTSDGSSYGVAYQRADSATTPYAGIIYDLTPRWSGFASYSKIFNPQTEVDSALQRLTPATGRSVDGGLKYESADKQLNGSATLFKTRQNNLATSDGYVGATAVYKGEDTHSQGIELETAGRINTRWQASASLTHMEIKDSSGADARSFTPRTQLQIATSYQLSSSLQSGARLRWQSDIHTQDGTVDIRQDAYAVLDLMLKYQFNKQWAARVNLNNVTDQRYLTSLYWTQSYYGAPRNLSVSLDWTY